MFWKIRRLNDVFFVDENTKEHKEISFNGTKCYTCGKLGVEECAEFDIQDQGQIKECSLNEVCLLYTWKMTSRGAIGMTIWVVTRNFFGS